MLFDFDYSSKGKHNFYISKKNLTFIENLCFCGLKIAVYAPKIPIISKNCRLKITEWSKNYGLKIPVRVCACARVCASEHQNTGPTEHTDTTEKSLHL